MLQLDEAQDSAAVAAASASAPGSRQPPLLQDLLDDFPGPDSRQRTTPTGGLVWGARSSATSTLAPLPGPSYSHPSLARFSSSLPSTPLPRHAASGAGAGSGSGYGSGQQQQQQQQQQVAKGRVHRATKLPAPPTPAPARVAEQQQQQQHPHTQELRNRDQPLPYPPDLLATSPVGDSPLLQ